MEPSEQLVEEIYREKVLRARKMSPGEKILAGPELFDFACAWTRAGILREHPRATEQQLLKLLEDRIRLGETSAEPPRLLP
jgi:hypothetical protein